MEKKQIIPPGTRFESIMNFEVGQIVKLSKRYYRIRKIEGDKIFVNFNKKEPVSLHYSHFKTKPKQITKPWTEKEIKVLYLGITTKQMSKKLKRNLGSIYNKMHMLGIPITKKKSLTKIYNELKIKRNGNRSKRTYANG